MCHDTKELTLIDTNNIGFDFVIQPTKSVMDMVGFFMPQILPSIYSHTHTHIWVCEYKQNTTEKLFSNYRDFPFVMSYIITTFALSNLKNNGGKDYERI